MKLSDLFRRQPLDDVEFGRLENGLSEALMVEFAPPLSPEADLAPLHTADDLGAQDDAVSAPRITSYTQSRLAEFAAFEHMHIAVQSDLEEVSAILAKIKAASHQSREFLNTVHSSIHRTNELELTAAKSAVHNRLLLRQAEQVNRIRSQHETLVDAFKQREASRRETAETLRGALSSVKLELVEAQSAIATMEAERQDTMTALAAARTQSERMSRENEVLREKQVNLAGDLETVTRKRSEADRKVDELTTIHARDTADIADARSKAASAEAERSRLQKQHDILQAKFVDMTETTAALETEMEEQAKRHDLSMQGLKNERDTLAARLEVSTRAELGAAERVGALNEALSDAVADRRIAQAKAAALERDGEMEEGSIEKMATLRRHASQL